MRRLLALLTLIALAGCSRRERANPLDPANPTTGGGPTGFNAIADFSLVRLRWDPQLTLGIDGFELDRLAPGDSLYRPVPGVLPAQTSQFIDSSVRNGQTYRYRLYYVTGGARGTRAASDEATPGAARIWVSDRGWPALLRISPDGRDVAQAVGVGEPNALVYDPASQYVWYTDFADRQVRLYDPQVLADNHFTGFGNAQQIALDPVNESVWITDSQAGNVRHLYPTGAAATPGTLSLLDVPTGITVDTGDRSVWVCERAGNRVRHYDVNGTPIATTSVTAPSRVAVDSVSHIAWVTSFDRGLVTLLASDGRHLDSLTIASGPIGLAIDRPQDRVWITDALGDRVFAVRLSTHVTQFTVSGLHGARDVAVDHTTGEAYVLAATDGALVRLSATGVELQRVRGLSAPVEVQFDPGH